MDMKFKEKFLKIDRTAYKFQEKDKPSKLPLA